MKNFMNIKIGGIIAVLVILIGAYIFGVTGRNEPSVQGSISGSGDAYNSTTTDATWNSTPTTCWRQLRSSGGILGSVVITGASATKLAFYDSTTTGAHADYSTTTLAQFPASVAAGTYTFDLAFSRGLVVDFASAGQVCSSVASSTITWK